MLNTLSRDEWGIVKKYLMTKTRKESENMKVFLSLEKRKGSFIELDINKFIDSNFPKSTKKAIQNIMSKLLAWVEECLSIQSFLNDQLRQKMFVALEYNQRGLYDEATRHAIKLLVILEKPVISLEKQKIKAELLHALYYSDNPLKADREFDLYHKMIDAHLFDSKNKINLYQIEMLNYSDIMKKDVTSDFENLMNLAGQMKEGSNSDLLNRLIKIVQYQGKEEFNSIYEILLERGVNKDDSLSHICIMYMYNYLARYWTKGLYKDDQLIFKIVDLGMEHGSFMLDDGIPLTRFQNLTSTLAAISTYESTALFIEKWYMKIHSNNKEDARRIAFGLNAFYNDRYSEIIPMLRGVKTEDYEQKIKVYSLELIALSKDVDLNYELFYNQSNNFKRFLRNNKDKISQKVYDSNMNFTKVLEKMMDTSSTFKIEDLANYPTLLYRKWLTKELS